jgi:hypothetical protein
MRFRLTKWYLDVVGEANDCAIIYAAEIGLGGLHLVANALLATDPRESAGQLRERVALLGTRLPDPLPEGGWSWRCDRLDAEGRWEHPRFAAPERVLHEVSALGGSRALRWALFAGSSTASLRIGSTTIRGHGYIERLELTIAPWELPISELRWGRVAARDRSVVWIQWRGAAPLDIVLVDGRERPGAMIDDEAVRWENGAITLTPKTTLRDAAIGEGALALLPEPLRRASPDFLRARETKWFGDATLDDERGRATHPAIWERVRFAGDPAPQELPA